MPTMGRVIWAGIGISAGRSENRGLDLSERFSVGRSQQLSAVFKLSDEGDVLTAAAHQ